MPRLDRDQFIEFAEAFENGASPGQLRDEYTLGSRAVLNHLMGAWGEGVVSDARIATLRVDRTLHEFPENPELQLEGVLSCMNSELKQATILVLDDIPRTCSNIRRGINRLTNVTLPKNDNFSAYCIHTISPIGFLAQEVFGQGLGFVTRYFTLSEQGERCGQPIAAFSLRYAVDNEISLYSLLGPTSSSGDSRAPYNRTRIIELLGEGVNTVANLGEQIGINDVGINRHLRHLEELRLLEFDSPINTEIKNYTWVEGRLPEEAEMVGTYKKLTEDVANWLYNNNGGNYRDIAEGINYNHLSPISKTLTGLARQGLVSTQFSSHNKSDVMLTERSALFSNYTQSVRNALEGGAELNDMRDMFDEFMQNETLFGDYLNRGIALYNNVSPFINSMTRGEREAEIMEFIREYQTEHGMGLRPIEITNAFGWSHGTTGRYLGSLFHNGSLTRESNGRVARYSIPDLTASYSN